MNEGLPLKGILNFFLKNPHAKELSIIPWDDEKDKDKVFNKEQLLQLERFHLKSPQVIINGITFIDAEIYKIYNKFFDCLKGIFIIYIFSQISFS